MDTEKRELIVLDLDGTLITYDSFGKLVKMHLFYPAVLLQTLLRKLRIIDAYTFKCRIVTFLQKKTWCPDLFAQQIIHSFQPEVIQKIEKNITPLSQIILLSASPDVYVSEIAKQMGWAGFGSITGKEYMDPLFHLHGKNKLLFLQKRYPKGVYLYKFAIADSESDLALLEQFENYELLK